MSLIPVSTPQMFIQTKQHLSRRTDKMTREVRDTERDRLEGMRGRKGEERRPNRQYNGEIRERDNELPISCHVDRCGDRGGQKKAERTFPQFLLAGIMFATFPPYSFRSKISLLFSFFVCFVEFLVMYILSRLSLLSSLSLSFYISSSLVVSVSVISDTERVEK